MKNPNPVIAMFWALVSPSRFARTSIEHDVAREFETNKELLRAYPDRNLPTEMRESFQRNIENRIVRIRYALFAALWSTIFAVALGLAAGYLAGRVLGRPSELVLSALQIVGIAVILVATLALLGWEIQSWEGTSLAEKVNRWLFRTQYWFGTALLVFSLSWASAISTLTPSSAGLEEIIMWTAVYEWFKGLDSGGVGNLIATAAAIVAIVGLIYQSRATGKQVKLQNFIEYTKRYQEIILNFPENINEKEFSFEGMPPDQRNKTMRYMRAYFDLCFEEYTLHKKKFIDNDLWSMWKGGLEVAFSKSAFKQAWTTIRKDTKFGDDFHAFVDSHMRSSNLQG